MVIFWALKETYTLPRLYLTKLLSAHILQRGKVVYPNWPLFHGSLIKNWG